MAIRKIRFIGDPCLNKVCKPVQKITPSIETLIEDMFDTMYEARGVGLAAPQVGILRRICVIDVMDGDLSSLSIQKSLKQLVSRQMRKDA